VNTANRLPAADRKLLTERLIAAVLWHEQFEERGWPDAAANELDEMRRIAQVLEAGK